MCMYTEVTCNRHCMCVEDREPLDSCCHWCATPDSTTALRLTSTKRSHCRCGSLKNIQSPLQSPSGGGSPTLSSECSTREFLKARMLQDKGPVLKANVICGGGGTTGCSVCPSLTPAGALLWLSAEAAQRAPCRTCDSANIQGTHLAEHVAPRRGPQVCQQQDVGHVAKVKHVLWGGGTGAVRAFALTLPRGTWSSRHWPSMLAANRSACLQPTVGDIAASPREKQT